jgi:hypothetical protein
MTYSAIALAAQDEHLRRRIAACIAQEDPTDDRHPIAHADALIWQACGSPGWGEAYAYALATNVENPGDDPAVISDAMILAAVQPMLTQEDT